MYNRSYCYQNIYSRNCIIFVRKQITIRYFETHYFPSIHPVPKIYAKKYLDFLKRQIYRQDL